MADDKEAKPETVVDELIIDIYANPVLDSLVILIDRPFQSRLQKLVLHRKAASLEFVFEKGSKDLGAPLKKDILSYFLKRKSVEFFQMDMKTRQPVDGMVVPLEISA